MASKVSLRPVRAPETGQPTLASSARRWNSSSVIPGISEAEFQRIAEEAKVGCPVSGALTGLKITLDATLVP